MTITPGLNLRPALKLARKLDCSVEPVRRTGEVRVNHPSIPGRVTINSRRESAPRQLTTYLKRVAQQVGD